MKQNVQQRSPLSCRVKRDLLPSSSLASSLLLIAVGRVGGGGVFSLGMVRAAEDELKDWMKLRSIESGKSSAAATMARPKKRALILKSVILATSSCGRERIGSPRWRYLLCLWRMWRRSDPPSQPSQVVPDACGARDLSSERSR